MSNTEGQSVAANYFVIEDILEKDVPDKYSISESEKEVLECWDEFYKGINLKVIGFPVWVSEFGLEYDLSCYPAWKADICRKNRKLYLDNKEFIDSWMKKWNGLDKFVPSRRKLEWQAGKDISSLWEGLIQFRPSGIRVKRPDVFPALVALVQIPIIGRYRRRLTPRETARLQSFPDSFVVDTNDHQAYKQFGNAVNVKCAEFLARQLFEYGSLKLGLGIV